MDISNLLLTPASLVELCVSTEKSEQLLSKARDNRIKVWAPVSALSELQRQIIEQGTNFAARLQQLGSQIQWLSALSEEVALLNRPDFDQARLSAAIDRLPGLTVILTQEKIPNFKPAQMSLEEFFSSSVKAQEIAFIDLEAQQDRIRGDLERRLHRVLHHGQYIMGPEVKEMEQQLATYVGSKHCIGVANGTDALLVALMALGIEAGDEVITTPFTFFATGEMIGLLGARAVFVDIDPKTYNIDPAKIEAAITSRTKAIMPVSLYGQCSDMVAIAEIAKKHKLPVIEDAAQSFGATHHGKQSCALSEIGCTSFFPSKPLGAYGDAGACFTDNDALAERMRQIRVHGQDRRYHHPWIGLNARIDTLQAALLMAKIAVFPDEVRNRGHIGQRYSDQFKGKVTVPFIETFNTSIFAQYTIEVADRDGVQKRLKDRGIPTAVHYPMPLHMQPALKKWGYKEGDFPLAEKAAKCVMSLPMHPYMSEREQDFVVQTVLASLS